MSQPPHSSEDLQKIYRNRFSGHLEYRSRVWQALTSRYFSRLIPPSATVLDLGCGYGEFINNIRCSRKYAMDMNPSSREYLAKGVEFLEQDCSRPWALPDRHLDVVFTSNFFEHLPAKTVLADTVAQAARCLKEGGLLIAMGPNARMVGGAYWDFWDHHLPLTDEALCELFRLHGFEIVFSAPRFLPYTMVNQRPVPILLVSIYLRLPILWRFFGKQFLVVARLTGRTAPATEPAPGGTPAKNGVAFEERRD
ncbi:MAG: class I SAM-dependent methyltransferase [Acidobacteria bacterium]|nr:class I SAM-dependent methyltransferase [Acidobacteriota bacterium]